MEYHIFNWKKKKKESACKISITNTYIYFGITYWQRLEVWPKI